MTQICPVAADGSTVKIEFRGLVNHERPVDHAAIEQLGFSSGAGELERCAGADVHAAIAPQGQWPADLKGAALHAKHRTRCIGGIGYSAVLPARLSRPGPVFVKVPDTLALPTSTFP